VGAAITAIAACPTSKLFITGDRSGKVKMWDLADRKLIRSLPLHTGSITGIHFSPNGKAFATTGEDGILKMFQLQPASLRHSLQVSAAPIFSSGLLGGRFFTTSADSKLRGIDSGKIIQESDLSSPLCKAMAINLQKKWVAIGDDRASVHCLATNGDLVKSFAAFPEGAIRSLEFLAGGNQLIIAGASPLIKIWNVATGNLVMEWDVGAGQSTAVASSGKQVAIAVDQTIQLWQLP
jgi:WD40 repeat protein